MAWSKLDIVNLSLGLLGKGPVESLDIADYTRIASTQYDLLVQAELASPNWRFATTLAELARSVDSPLVDDWTYIYQLPADYLALWKIYPKGTPYQIYENKTLYTNATTVKIEYRFLCDASRFPAYFVNYIYMRLASVLGFSIAENKALVDKYDALATKLYPQALFADAQSHPNQDITDNPFVDVRL